MCQQKGHNEINCGKIVSYPQGCRGRVAIIKSGTKREQNPLAYNCVRNKARGWDKLSHHIWRGWVDRLRGAGKITHTYTYTYAPRKIFSKFQTFFFQLFSFSAFRDSPAADRPVFELSSFSR